jgi:hypothetical protein
MVAEGYLFAEQQRQPGITTWMMARKMLWRLYADFFSSLSQMLASCQRDHSSSSTCDDSYCLPPLLTLTTSWQTCLETGSSLDLVFRYASALAGTALGWVGISRHR